MPLSLGILDQSPIRSGGTAAQAIAETLALARLADQLGYARYWLAEHHSSGAFAGPAPEILIGRVASETSRIRVGSGGVMLGNYSPLKVAECFRLLETLHPGRIDLGIGRAPGAMPRASLALRNGGQGGPDVTEKLRLVLGFLTDQLATEPLYRGVHAVPRGAGMPELWLLGSGAESGALAGELGMAFCYAHFIQGEGPEALDAYRRSFRPSPWLAAPRSALGVSAVCAEHEKEARALTLSAACWAVRLVMGKGGTFPSVEEIEEQRPTFTPEEIELLEARRAQIVAGAPEQARARLVDLAQRHGTDELFVVTITPDFESRKRSYALLAQAFGLLPEAP